VLVGAIVNCRAVGGAVEPGSDIAILCAGTDGKVTKEDWYAGGAIAFAAKRSNEAFTYDLNDHAKSAMDAWRTIVVDARAAAGAPLVNHFAEQLKWTDGGRNLIAIGQDADLPRCAQIDIYTVVPELNPATGELRPA
jgi:2-phosphosulfolactate phosphatase